VKEWKAEETALLKSAHSMRLSSTPYLEVIFGAKGLARKKRPLNKKHEGPQLIPAKAIPQPRCIVRTLRGQKQKAKSKIPCSPKRIARPSGSPRSGRYPPGVSSLANAVLLRGHHRREAKSGLGSYPAPPCAEPGIIALVQLRKHLAQEVDFLLEEGVFLAQSLDAAAGMQDSGVIASAEAPTDFGQGARRQFAGEIHRHLARTGHTARTLGRMEVAYI
jgi:hypothetical protein